MTIAGASKFLIRCFERYLVRYTENIPLILLLIVSVPILLLFQNCQNMMVGLLSSGILDPSSFAACIVQNGAWEVLWREGLGAVKARKGEGKFRLGTDVDQGC